MKKAMNLVTVLYMGILFVIGILDMTNVMTIYGSFLTPLLSLATISSINVIIAQAYKKIAFRIAQTFLALLVLAGTFFMFIPINKDLDIVLSSISATLLIGTSVFQMVKPKKK